MGEFDLISSYFYWDYSYGDDNNKESGVVVGNGDDAAVLQLAKNQQLVTSIDTLISGVHFPEQTPAEAIAYKSLAVNLSDLAAMGATPKWFTLALTLPEIDHDWLKRFSTSLKNLADNSDIRLIGGDTTRGSLSISIQVMGEVDKNTALLRSGAQQGDQVFVTGTLGDAALGLASIKQEIELTGNDKSYCESRLNYPTARLKESQIIKQYASSCIDLSDGLLQDLGHILKQSKVSAVLDIEALPLSSSLKKIDRDQANKLALSSGDDFELLFTVAADKATELIQKMPQYESLAQITLIGKIVEQRDVAISVLSTSDGTSLNPVGYNHFEE